MIQNVAALLLESTTMDLPALAALLTIIVGVSVAIASLITGMIVKPMITKAKDEIIAAMVSKEVFNVYADNDKREHAEMKQSLKDLAAELERM